jgi:L-alanine-DL-glutamate epimerase-like enolase superfamily enzyme
VGYPRQGGLFGHIHAHLGCCVDNTDFYEYFGQGGDNLRRAGQQWGLLNAPLIEDGHIMPTDVPGWGAEWDEERYQGLVVERHEG